MTLKGQGHDPNMFGAHYLRNGWRHQLGDNRAPIGNGYLGMKWSRDRWRHVTLKGRGRDPNMVRALEPNISKTAGDRDLVTMDHL